MSDSPWLEWISQGRGRFIVRLERADLGAQPSLHVAQHANTRCRIYSQGKCCADVSAPCEGAMSAPNLYDALIMDHIRNARNYRALVDATQEAAGANPLCGDEMVVGIRLVDDRLADVGFQCTCCGISMASASIMSEMVKGMSRAEVELLLRHFLSIVQERAPAVPEAMSAEWRAILDTVNRFPSRVRCAALPWTTLEAALQQLQPP
jgi:nitrogen fixation NifU-like protein